MCESTFDNKNAIPLHISVITLITELYKSPNRFTRISLTTTSYVYFRAGASHAGSSTTGSVRNNLCDNKVEINRRQNYSRCAIWWVGKKATKWAVYQNIGRQQWKSVWSKYIKLMRMNTCDKLKVYQRRSCDFACVCVKNQCDYYYNWNYLRLQDLRNCVLYWHVQTMIILYTNVHTKLKYAKRHRFETIAIDY